MEVIEFLVGMFRLVCLSLNPYVQDESVVNNYGLQNIKTENNCIIELSERSLFISRGWGWGGGIFTNLAIFFRPPPPINFNFWLLPPAHTQTHHDEN